MFRRLLAAGVLGLAAVAGATGAAVTASASPVAPVSTGWSASSGGGFSLAISGLPRHPALRLGGSPLTFTVTVRNKTSRPSFRVSPVIAIDHCECSSNPIRLAPLGTLQEYNPVTRTWHKVTYNAIAGGMDFVVVVQQPPFALLPGQARSFTFRVAFLPAAKQLIRYGTGPTAIGAWLMREPVNPVVAQSLRPLTHTEVPVELVK